MDMKNHILSALREQVNRWEELLASLDENQITTPLLPSPWTPKDVLTHLWAWQQRSIARVEAALAGREPQFPAWPPNLDPETQDVEKLNDWIYTTQRDQPWPEVHQSWQVGFLHFLTISEQITEIDLLDSNRYAWLESRPLVLVLLASYDHHQEHYDKLVAWLQQH